MKDYDLGNRLQHLAALKRLMDSYYQENRIPERQKLSVEMILRKSFVDTLKEYAGNCSLAGVQKMIKPGIGMFERFVRILVFLTAMGTSGYFLLYIWSDTLNKPLIVTMESSTYPISKIDFPAVAVCNVNRISKKALQKLAREEYHDLAKHNEPIEEVEAMLLQWGRLIDFSYNESLRKNPIYRNLVEKYLIDTDRVAKIMEGLAPNCEEQLLRCLWEGEVVDCASIFTMRRTSLGHCCTFNFILKYDPTENDMKVLDSTKRQTESGFIYGLNIVLNPMIDDYAYPLSHTIGYDVLIFPPLHFADERSGRVIRRKVEPNWGVFFQLSSTKQIATREVRKYGLQTRNCFFHDEFATVFGNTPYSYSACIVYCRVMTIQSLCKCTPYFNLAHVFQGPLCTLDSLRCLNKYKEKLSYLYPMDTESTIGLEMEIQDSLFCAECYPDCELTSYTTKSYKVSSINAYDPAKNFVNGFLIGLNMTNKSVLSVFHPNVDATLNRLDVVNYWYEIVSSVGGFGGVFIGFSIMSIVEIVYFFTIRFCCHFRRNYLEHHYN